MKHCPVVGVLSYVVELSRKNSKLPLSFSPFSCAGFSFTMEAMLNTTKLAVPHPYYPAEAEIVGYLANEFSTPVLLAFFVGGCAAISALTLSIVNRGHQHLSNKEKATILWFVLSKPAILLRRDAVCAGATG